MKFSYVRFILLRELESLWHLKGVIYDTRIYSLGRKIDVKELGGDIQNKINEIKEIFGLMDREEKDKRIVYSKKRRGED